MKKVFITGISGFAGSHLREYLQKTDRDLEVFGTDLHNRTNLENIFTVDLTNREEVFSLIRKIQPDYVFHLAALASPAKSFLNPCETFTINLSAQINILDALKSINSQARILIVGSGDEYGIVQPENNPVAETQPFNPASPYAVSKISQDFLALQYFNSYKLNIVRVRPFNHIGPRQNPAFVVSSFCKQIAEIENSLSIEEIKVGNLSAVRDFTDVSDMVKAYWLAVNNCEFGEVYNIGSGEGKKMSDILNILLSASVKKIKIKISQELLRPSDNPILICNFQKFQKRTGWKPEVRLEDSLVNILNYWRVETKRS